MGSKVCCRREADMAYEGRERLSWLRVLDAAIATVEARRRAGVQKPPKEETAGRKGSSGRDLWGFAGRGRSAEVGPEAAERRLRRSEGRWRACSIVQMRGLSASRRAKETLPRLVRTLPSWSGARLEGKAIGSALLDAGRR